MKEMIYSSEMIQEVLDEGIEEGIKYIIISLGRHPCAYIGVPENHPLANLDYNIIPIKCHYGLTYGREGTDDYLPKGYFWYGWDYGHSGDYMGYYKEDSPLAKDAKRWTTKEIKNEVLSVIWTFKKLMDLVKMLVNSEYKLVRIKKKKKGRK